MDDSVSTAAGQGGLDFANILRESLASGFIVVSERRQIEGFNNRAEKLLRLKTDHVLGKSIDTLPAPLRQYIEAGLAASGDQDEHQLVLSLAGGQALTIHASVTAIGSAGAKAPGVAVVFWDVSSARNWEANMRRLDRLHSVGTLSASMAHEVKNAFVAVRTFIDLLLEQNKQADLAVVVRGELTRIDAILSQMRKLSGPVQPHFSEVRLHTVVDRSLVLIQHLLEEKKIKVTRSLGASPDLVKGDSDQLEQAFINLFFNALDAMKPDGRLTVSTMSIPAGAKDHGLPQAHSRPAVRLAIHDNGSGISPENLSRLFEPFFTTKPDGTGLGLAITRRIIQEHHGAIAVRSEPNQGTTFTLTLPSIAGA